MVKSYKLATFHFCLSEKRFLKLTLNYFILTIKLFLFTESHKTFSDDTNTSQKPKPITINLKTKKQFQKNAQCHNRTKTNYQKIIQIFNHHNHKKFRRLYKINQPNLNMAKIKCKLCDEEIAETFLGKIAGTIIKSNSKKYYICSACQKEHKNNLKEKLE